jgi:hypothetical protein
MTAPVRLLYGAGDAYTRELLTSAVVLDDPDDAALHRTLAGLAAGAVTVTAAAAAQASAVSAAAVSSGAVAAEGLAASGKAAVISVVAKWIGIGAVGGLATAGGAQYIADASRAEPSGAPAAAQVSDQQRERPAPQPRALEAPAHAVASATVADEEAGDAAAPSPSPAPMPEPTARTRPASPSPRAPSGDNPLAAELVELDAARRALARGDTASALQALDAYAASRKTGVLDREAMILRIDALVIRGDKPRAVQLAERYIARFPGDAHVNRLKQLVAAP